MTQIEQMYVDEANEKIRQAIAENTEKVTTNAIKKMLYNGLEPSDISMYFDNVTVEDIEAIRSTL